MKIAFIGLGTMGMPMAKCLKEAGFVIQGWDIEPNLISAFGSQNQTLEQLVSDSDTIISMLPEGEHVEDIYRQVLAAVLPAESLFIDCSTIDVETTRQLARKLELENHDFVDAPVSGGSEAAQSGSLSFMIGGSSPAKQRAQVLLDAMGKKVSDFGEAGAGQSAKACHNMICGITALGVCEAFALADSLNLDLEQFFQLCQGAAAQSWILENRCPIPGPAPTAPSSNNYAPGFAARLMAKDLGLAQRAAESSGQQTEFGAIAAKRFAEYVDNHDGDLDFSAIYKTIRLG